MSTTPADPASQTTDAALTATQVAAVDEPSQVDGFTTWVQAQGDVRLGRSRFLIGGIHCAACAGLIEAAIARVPGVREVSVQGASARAQVLWDAATVRPSAIIEAVRGAGYEAFPDTGASAVDQQAREARQALWRLFVAAFLMMQVMMVATPAYVAPGSELAPDLTRLLQWAGWVMSIPVLLFAAAPFLRGAWRSLRAGSIGMDVPVAVGIVVAFVASSFATFSGQPSGHSPAGAGGEVYFDSLSMFVAFLLAARALETRLRSRAAHALDAVMRRMPDAVERLDASDRGELVPPARLLVGDRVRVHLGQAFPADGVVVHGRTQVDESLLTGESMPVTRQPGDPVSAGCLNVGAPVVITVQRLGAQTRYQHIVTLVERAMTQRPRFLRSIDRAAGPFLWGVLALAAIAATAWSFIDPSRAVWVAVAVLIVTCPCALSLGAPVALLSAAGELARRGILVQRLDAIEALARADRFVFDKTGTLTEDRLGLASVSVEPAAATGPARSADELAALAASLARHSRHPLSRALAGAVGNEAGGAETSWTSVIEHAGDGVQGQAQGGPWRLGRPMWAAPQDAARQGDARAGGPQVWLSRRADDGGWVLRARFGFDELVRPDAADALATLKEGHTRISIVSGDGSGSVEAIAGRLAVDDAHAQATPDDKLERVRALQREGHTVVMVGDGINDAPVLACADVSIAMGSAAALAQSRADLVILSNRLADIAAARDTARRALRIVRQNLAWAAIYNFASVPLALTGHLPPWLAGIGMASSSLIVVANSLRVPRRDRITRPAPASRTVARAF